MFEVDIPVTAISVVFLFRVVSTFSSGFFDEEELILVQLKRRQLAAALAATTTGAQDDRTDKSIGFTWAAHIARLDEAEFKRRYRLSVDSLGSSSRIRKPVFSYLKFRSEPHFSRIRTPNKRRTLAYTGCYLSIGADPYL